MKKSSALILALMLLLPAAPAPAEQAVSGAPLSYTAVISEDTDLHQIALDISPDDFNGLGFRFGDSCDVLFSDGYVLKDIPYYNGYYCRSGESLLVAYPGYEQVRIAVNNGAESWTAYNCREGETVTVTLAEAGKYADIQNALNTVYSNNRADYPDDETFANFRPLSVGRIRKDTFYRGASPMDDTYRRAAYADRLIRDAGVRYVIDLADTDESIRRDAELYHPEYALTLYKAGLVVPLSLGFSYMSESYQASLSAALLEMMKHEGPYYIHCQEGKDRTGFVCMLLEALGGADAAELEADYMKTYANYYGILPGSAKYDAIVSVKFTDECSQLAALGGGDPEAGARAYFRRGGMTEEEVDRLRRFLTGE